MYGPRLTSNMLLIYLLDIAKFPRNAQALRRPIENEKEI